MRDISDSKNYFGYVCNLVTKKYADVNINIYKKLVLWDMLTTKHNIFSPKYAILDWQDWRSNVL